MLCKRYLARQSAGQALLCLETLLHPCRRRLTGAGMQKDAAKSHPSRAALDVTGRYLEAAHCQ